METAAKGENSTEMLARRPWKLLPCANKSNTYAEAIDIEASHCIAEHWTRHARLYNWNSGDTTVIILVTVGYH